MLQNFMFIRKPVYPLILPGWGVMDEGFFDNLKLRAAYGQSANFPAFGSKFTTLVASNIAGHPGFYCKYTRW